MKKFIARAHLFGLSEDVLSGLLRPPISRLLPLEVRIIQALRQLHVTDIDFCASRNHQFLVDAAEGTAIEDTRSAH